MSNARRTPRYVGVIEPLPIGPQLVAPQPVRPALEPTRFGGADVIPIRPGMPQTLPPMVGDSPTPARPRKAVTPVTQRPWRVLILPASPSAKPRSFDFARWHARLVIGTLAVLLLLAAGCISVLVAAARDPELFTPGSDIALLRDRIATLEDSLADSRDDISDLQAARALDSAASAAAIAAAASTPAGAATGTRLPRLLHSRTRGLRPTASSGPAAGTDSRLFEGLPVIGAIASGFSMARRHPLLHIIRPHLGLDIAAPRGTPVTAPASGRVSFVGHKFGFGLVVEISHAHAVMTRYGHLQSASVHEGDRVAKGQLVAKVGSSGISTGPHLHYEVIAQGTRVDPIRYHFVSDVPRSATTADASAAAPSLPLPVSMLAPSVAGSHDDGGPTPPTTHR
ncbi:MAG: Murein DD-endopeptidase MepM, murein hydrolase activator NlpD [Gemmatimonadetes bacterium]|jgi:murein DD-endopeptidase MepM/ murein hydrolase activator NlpD|nr:Murein DD-endopeptidase MepM, murein hydrolase activator NlpD [Gemmatimonadota bacterium]